MFLLWFLSFTSMKINDLALVTLYTGFPRGLKKSKTLNFKFKVLKVLQLDSSMSNLNVEWQLL